MQRGKAEKSRAQWRIGLPKAQASGVLVLGVLTVDYRIRVNSPNRKRVNPGNSGAGFQRFVHHESEKGQSKRRKRKPVYERYRAIVIARGESECTYVYRMLVVHNTRRKRENGEVLYV